MQVQIAIQIENELVNNYAQHLNLTLNSSLKQKIQSLVEKLEASPHITEDLKKQLAEWKIQALKQNNYFDSFTADDEKEDAVEKLTMLFLSVIRPALVQCKSSKAWDDISCCKKEYKKILEFIISNKEF